HRIELLEPFAHKPHAEIVICGHRSAGAFGDVEGVADMVAVAVSEQDMADALHRRCAIRHESRIAGEERVDQHGLAFEVETESGMPVPGDLHGNILSVGSWAKDTLGS